MNRLIELAEYALLVMFLAVCFLAVFLNKP